MNTRRKILLLQWPASIGSDSYFFEQLGFDVVCEHIVSFDYLAEHVGNLVETLNKFDFIVLDILGSPNFSEVTFPSEKVEKLKNKINDISNQRGISISLIGMHMCLNEKFKRQQQALFDGMFIDMVTPIEKIKLLLNLS